MDETDTLSSPALRRWVGRYAAGAALLLAGLVGGGALVWCGVRSWGGPLGAGATPVWPAFVFAGVAGLAMAVYAGWILRALVRRMEAEAEALRLYRRVLEEADEAILITDPAQPDNPIVYVNPRFEEMTGYAAADVIGHNPRMLQGPETNRETVARVRKAVEERRPVQCEIVNYRRDGAPFRKEMSIAPVFDEQGRLRRFFSVQTDVTARRRAEVARERLAAIVESSDDAVAGLDPEGCVESWNPAAERLYGYPADEAVGCELGDLLFGLKRAEWREALAAVREGRAVSHRETVLYRRDGGAVDVSLTLFPVRDREGRLVGASALSHDITARKRYETALAEQNAMLEAYATEMESLAAERARALVHADRLASLGTLAAGVAHEINNPVSYIAGNLDLVRESWPRAAEGIRRRFEPQDAAAGEIRFLLDEMPPILESFADGVKRIRGIVQDLRGYVHKGGERREAVELADVVRRALTLCRNRLKYKIDVDTDIPDGLPPVRGDAQRLEQVFINLFLNAADAMGASGGVLRIVARREGAIGSAGAGIRLEVRDTGPGLPPDAFERIWDPFFTTKEADVGTGLGLAISRTIVEEHGGRITAENAPEGGAVFRVTLPTPPPGEDAQTKDASVNTD